MDSYEYMQSDEIGNPNGHADACCSWVVIVVNADGDRPRVEIMAAAQLAQAARWYHHLHTA